MGEGKLWNRNFILLWLGNAQSAVGNTLYIVALSYLILDLTGSPKYTAITMAAAALPYIFSPFAGAIVDRINMKKYLVIGDFIRAGGMFFICWLAFYNLLHVLLIIGTAFLLGIVGLIYRPSFAVLLPRLIPSSEIARANALNSTTARIASLLGFMFGGIIVSWLGSIPAILINGFSFFIMSFLLMIIDFPEIKHPHKTSDGVWLEVKEGFNYLLSTKLLLMIPIIFFIMNVSYSPLEILMPLKMQEMNEGAKGYGTFFASLSIGAIVISAFISKFGKNLNTRSFTIIGLSVMAISMGGIALSNNLLVACIFSSLFGAGSSLVGISNITYVQTEVDDKYRGRIFGVFGTIEQAGMPASLALIGFLVDYVEAKSFLLFFAFLLALVGILWFIFNLGFRRQNQKSHPTHEQQNF
ncbi:MFS family permease [Kroppenstedtia sanguinis]|uniref:MFS transporter n=1 Tax=Kroppenstedtia sanguinis TaxID=1380684 RepID=UPI003D24EE04